MITPMRAFTIAQEANRLATGDLSGGKLVYNTDGTGGEWYSNDTYRLGFNVVIVPVRRGHSMVSILELFNGPDN